MSDDETKPEPQPENPVQPIFPSGRDELTAQPTSTPFPIGRIEKGESSEKIIRKES